MFRRWQVKIPSEGSAGLSQAAAEETRRAEDSIAPTLLGIAESGGSVFFVRLDETGTRHFPVNLRAFSDPV